MKKKVKDLRRSGIVFAAVAGIVLMLTGCIASPGGLFGNDHKETDKTGSSSVKRREEKTDKKSTGDKDTAVLGIIYTRDTEGNSLISWWDDDLEQSSETGCDFSAAYFDGFRNACTRDGLIYLFPRGDYVKKNAKELVVIDAADRDCEKIDTGISNVTGFAVDDDCLCFSSNEDNTGKVSLMDLQSRGIKTMTLDNALVFDVALSGGEVYGMALDDELKVRLMKLDIEAGKSESILELPDEDTPGFIQVDGRTLLFLTEGQLACYDLDKRELTKTALTQAVPYNLNLEGDRLLIGYTDIFGSDSQTSLLEVRDAKSLDVLASAEVPGAVLQIERSGDDIYVLGYKALRHYQLKDSGDLREVKKIGTNRKGYDVGGFFLTNNSAQQNYGDMSEEEAVRLNDRLFDAIGDMKVEEERQ